MEKEKCNCDENQNLVITCSGAADVGYISDQVGRLLMKNNHCKMSCMALFASCNDEKINKLKNKNILVIDGCKEDCGKKVMEKRGIDKYTWLRLTDMGYEKGKITTSNVTIKNIHDNALQMLK